MSTVQQAIADDGGDFADHGPGCDGPLNCTCEPPATFHPATCPAPVDDHTHATVVKRCKGRFGTCNKAVQVDVWRYVIGVDRLRQMGSGRCAACYHVTDVVGDVGTPAVIRRGDLRRVAARLFEVTS